MQSTLAGQTALAAQPSKLKKVLALLFSFIVGMVVISSALGSDDKTAPTSPASIPEYKRFPAPSAAEYGTFKSTTTLAFEVKHLSTKKVDGKYRYFFTIKNASSESVLKGRAVIELYSNDGPVTNDRFEAKEQFSAGTITNFYLEAHTSPDPVAMGYDLSVSSFKFAVYDADGYLLSTGDGKIPTTIIE